VHPGNRTPINAPERLRSILKKLHPVRLVLTDGRKVRGTVRGNDPAARFTRRTVAAGMVPLIGTPAIVRSASLMRLRGLVLPVERPHAGFVIRTGWTAEAARPFGGMSEREMLAAVTYARWRGFLT
jgi:hypothetical protein